MIEKLAAFKLNELRLIAYCLAYYDSTKPENRSCYAKVSDLQELFPIDKKSAYAVVERAMLGINEKPLTFREDGRKKFRNWFSGFDYIEGTGEFEFMITPEIRPYLLGLQETFTKYRLRDVYQFKSAHTWKLYENLKREAFKKIWSVSLDELKILLGIAGKYPRWNVFQQWVVAPCTEEINEKSDLSVKYDKQKKGRSVIGLVFQIIEKPDPDTIDVESPRAAIARLLALGGIHEKTISTYIEKAEKADMTTRCAEQLPKILERAKSKPTAERKKYIIGALKKEIATGAPLFDDFDKKEKAKDAEKARARARAIDDEPLKDLAMSSGNAYYIEEAKARGLI
jgi:plasmid replication initiation protein